MMLYQAVLETPDWLDVFAQDEDGNYLIGNECFAYLAFMEPEWPDSSTFPGTRTSGGRKLTHALLNNDSDDPAAEIDEAITHFGMDWQLRALCSVAPHLPYDENGDTILTDIDGVMTHVPEQIVERALSEAAMLVFMADVVVDDSDPENPVMGRPTEASIPHEWAGRLPVALG